MLLGVLVKGAELVRGRKSGSAPSLPIFFRHLVSTLSLSGNEGRLFRLRQHLLS